jgi:hypothetical protein
MVIQTYSAQFGLFPLLDPSKLMLPAWPVPSEQNTIFFGIAKFQSAFSD